MAITAEEFNKIFKATKEVLLPALNVSFTLRKLTNIDLKLNGLEIPLQTAKVVLQNDKKIETTKIEPTIEELKTTRKFNDDVLILAVVEPLLCSRDEFKSDKVSLSQIPDNDYYFLINEVINFSFGRQDLKPFREEQTPDNIGSDSKAI